MKKLLLLALMFMPLGLQAQNYFTAGTEWIVETTYLDKETLDIRTSYSYYYLVDSEVTGAPGLELLVKKSNKDQQPVQLGWIKSEGDKVWFKKGNLPDWYLMYDFGLSPGQVEKFYSINGVDSDGLPWGTEMRCLEATENDPDFNGLSAQIMIDYDEENHEYADYWIAGIGSLKGVVQNNNFANIISDAGSSLMAVKHDGEVVFKNYPAGIENIETDESSVKSTDPSTPVYDLTGRVVGKQADLNSLPSGIYISSGKKILK